MTLIHYVATIKVEDMTMVDHVHFNIITSKMVTFQAVLLLSVGIAFTGQSIVHI